MQIFTTVHPGQRDVCLMLYQGESPVASRNKLMGQFHLVGLPPAPVGVPQIEVCPFTLSHDQLVLGGLVCAHVSCLSIKFDSLQCDMNPSYCWDG